MIAAAAAAGDAKAGTATVRLGEEFVKAGGGGEVRMPLSPPIPPLP